MTIALRVSGQGRRTTGGYCSEAHARADLGGAPSVAGSHVAGSRRPPSPVRTYTPGTDRTSVAGDVTTQMVDADDAVAIEDRQRGASAAAGAGAAQRAAREADPKAAPPKIIPKGHL